jgi:AcrR family transcriptional regulator
MTDLRAGEAGTPALRADARRNLEKLKAAAFAVFQERGLGAPLEEIAQRAGVSIGTLYNRFGTREALIDAVLADLATARLCAVVQEARARTDPWERFALYVQQICELQAADPALNDVISRRYPEAPQLRAACDESLENAGQFIEAAQRQGSLRPDFTLEDLSVVFWSNANLIRVTAQAAPGAWRRSIAFTLDGLRTEAARPLPVGPLSLDHPLHKLLRGNGERRSANHQNADPAGQSPLRGEG